MKILILYKSKWGSTEEYASYLHLTLPGSTISTINEFNTDKIKDYDCVIIGSRTYMGNIEARNFIEDNWDLLKSRPVYLFVVGLLDPKDKSSEESYNLIPKEIRAHIRYIKVPGRIRIEDLNLMQKIILKLQSGKFADINRVNVNKLDPILEWVSLM